MPDLSKPALAWTLPWDADWVTAVAFLGATRRVAAGNNRGDILVWELPAQPGGDSPEPLLRLAGHTNVISKLAATPDGKTLISASYDHTVRYWDGTATAEPTETVGLNAAAVASRKGRGKAPAPLEAKVGVVKPARTLDAHKEWVVNMDLSRDGKALITGDDAGQVIVWDRESSSVTKRWAVKRWVYALALSPDKKQACVGERYPTVFDSSRHAGLKLWDVATGTVKTDLSALKEFKGHHIGSAAYSPDGKLLAVGRGGEVAGLNGKVTLIDPAAGKVVRELAPAHQDGVTAVAFHPDGKHVCSAGRDTVVRIWEAATGKLVATVGKGRGGQFKDWVCAVSWSADGSWLAAADMAGATQVWNFR